jgi:2-keto-4-pentenoate hydratase/2-oxohepta-3-ene-1,7-dioic acid hydratase in catechol pathway
VHLLKARHHGSAAFWTLVEGDTTTAIDGPLGAWAEAAAAGDLARLPIAGQQLPLSELERCAPVEPSARIVGVGANYRDHLKFAGVEPPARPVVFLMHDDSVLGSEDVINFPAGGDQLDYEIELVVVMARGLAPGADPLRSVLGYAVGNDMSIRDAPRQFGGIDMFATKVFDLSKPVGPWLTTISEFGYREPDLQMTLTVNGEVRQSESTANMIFPIREVLEYLNERIALRCGDVIFTGTGSGVAMEDGRYLQPGDVVVAEIAGLGELRNRIGERRSVANPAARSSGLVGTD